MLAITSKIVFVWMIIVSSTIIGLLKYTDPTFKKFYRFGPSNNMQVLGFSIDTGWKYTLLVFYCFVNSLVRTLVHNVLSPWLINNVQDENKPISHEIKKRAYEVTVNTTVYNWFDWFIYMNILLAQIDMVIVEICADLTMSVATTFYYMKKKNTYEAMA